MADTPTNTIAAAKPGSGPLSGLYKTSTEIAQDAVSQMKQIQAANAAQNALEGYTKGLNGLYTPVADLAKSVGNKLMEMAGANPAAFRPKRYRPSRRPPPRRWPTLWA